MRGIDSRMQINVCLPIDQYHTMIFLRNGKPILDSYARVSHHFYDLFFCENKKVR